MGFELKKEIQLQRAEKPIKLGIMVREPSRGTVGECSKLKNGMTIVKQLL
jgi:hypothetical protein